MSLKADAAAMLKRLGVPPAVQAVATGQSWRAEAGQLRTLNSPIDGSPLATFPFAAASDVAPVVQSAAGAFHTLREIPAPRRGQMVRAIGERVRAHKADLAELVTLEVGKIRQESLGEVQEMIDVCDFAVGLSRQLYGLTIKSERPMHRMAELWHPLGPIGVITAFNFPVAVWAWNAMIALVCGDAVIWKPSELAPLTAIAVHHLAVAAIAETGGPADALSLIIGGADVGQALAGSRDLPLISATGSTAMGLYPALQGRSWLVMDWTRS